MKISVQENKQEITKSVSLTKNGGKSSKRVQSSWITK